MAFVRDNGGVSTPELAPRRTFGGVIAVWIAAAVIGVAVGVFAPADARASWLVAGLGVSVVLSFAVQLAYGRSQGFTQRVAAGALGALFVLGVISLGFGLAGVVPG
ncbi:hypothetical protein GCM10009796_12600 [Microbacterium koreense]